MKKKDIIDHITQWLLEYAVTNRVNGYVVGVSGGIDSALTSTLCAKTGLRTLVVEMPIYQAASQVNRGREHIQWLMQQFPNVETQEVELTQTFDAFMSAVPTSEEVHKMNLALANTRARLRMTSLYYFAGLNGLLVVGTGNKVEDFGVGFYTKYGDGGVDLSPIADLLKTEVYQLSAELGISAAILGAAPTDGLWGDDRTDEDQIGASYPELEWAMECATIHLSKDGTQYRLGDSDLIEFSDRQKEVMRIFVRMHNANRHKMDPIPVCLVPASLKG